MRIVSATVSIYFEDVIGQTREEDRDRSSDGAQKVNRDENKLPRDEFARNLYVL